MKYFMYSLILSLFTLFFLWCSIGYSQYGADLIYHHLNLEGMFIRFRDSFKFSYNFIDDIRNIKMLTNAVNKMSIANWVEGSIANSANLHFASGDNIFSFIVCAFNIFISPLTTIAWSGILFIYITCSGLQILFTIIDIVICIIDFVFFPMFI